MAFGAPAEMKSRTLETTCSRLGHLPFMPSKFLSKGSDTKSALELLSLSWYS